MLPPHFSPAPLPHPAPTGNGTKIIRCEVSLDDGKSWRLADIVQRAEPNAYGKHWAWVWWELDIPIGERRLGAAAWLHALTSFHDGVSCSSPRVLMTPWS